jgi:alkylation response protein AidB-like acyl-CoA dehydrogenase
VPALQPARGLPLQTPELPEATKQLRREVREFLANQDYEPRIDAWLSGWSPEFSRALGAHGWLGMTWPRRYGGHERTAIERHVVLEELLAAGAPVAAHWIADRQSGPLLLRYGSETQRERFLPPIARGECYFAIGMSEPDSGSDLASVTTTAVREGQGWRVRGRKVWTSGAHEAGFMISLVRTAPRQADRHEGLTQLIIDLHAEGVEVRPIRLITGEHHFNEVILDGVYVPDDLVVGHAGDGWKQVTAELAYERSGPERLLSTYRLLAEMCRHASDGHTHEAIGRLMARLWTLRLLSLGVAGRLGHGDQPAVEAALVKDLGTRFEREVSEVARSIYPPPRPEPLEALLRMAVVHGPGFTLRGGTTEILRSVVARALK